LPEQKISRVLYPATGGAMIIYLGPLSPKDSSDLPGSLPPHKAGCEAGHLSFPMRSCSQVGFTRSRVTTGTRGLLHHVFTLGLRLCSGRFVFCGTFRPLRAHVLRGTLPWRARTFLPSIPPEAGLKGDHLFCSGNTNRYLSNLFLKSSLPIKIRFL
jgi:hypothetical protein